MNLQNATTLLEASVVDLRGMLSIDGSSLCLRNLLQLKEDAKLIGKDATFNFLQDAEIRLGATCGSTIDCEYTTFKPKNTGETWKGINSDYNVLCNAIQSQYSLAPAVDNNGNCSKEEWAGGLNKDVSLVELNNCNFYNAEIAIDAYGGGSSPIPEAGTTVIRVRSTTFNNCHKGIRITDFTNSNGDPNASYIMTCNFITDNAYPFPNKQDLTHIELNNLGESGVNIGGCIFTNSINMPEQDAERGTGIKIYKGSVSIDQDGDRCKLVDGNECPGNGFADPLQSRNNEFHNLSYGVRVDQDSKTDYSASIRFSDFFDCYRAIDVKNAENTPINDNDFTLTQSTYSSYFANPNPADRYFINLEECGGYTVAKCTMNLHLDVATDKMTYIQATNATGLPVYNSKIKENEFHNNNSIGISNGIVLQDHTRGNDITCNTFENLTTDIWVKGNSANSHLLAIPKNDVKGSSNTFNASLNPNFVTNVNSDVPLVFHQKGNQPQTIGSVTLPGSSVEVDCDFICEDNENTTTASDDITTGVISVSKTGGLWVYEENANAIAIGSSFQAAFDICIYNLYGQCGVELEKVHSKTSIDVSSLANGIYFVSLRDSHGVETTLKFVKK
jgi:hypothetical protein